MKLSIIIPTLNESTTIRRLIERLLTADHSLIEIIIVDGGSGDNTIEIASEFPVIIAKCTPSRAKQMNIGANLAKGKYLYFVHADTLPPLDYLKDGFAAFKEGFSAACYRSEFDGHKKILRLNAFFTRFNWLVSRGGDQSLFIKKSTFDKLGQFDETMVIMEEYPLLQRLIKENQLKIIPKVILISSRKYKNRSWIKVSRANYIAFKLFRKGVNSELIRKKYSEKLS